MKRFSKATRAYFTSIILSLLALVAYGAKYGFNAMLTHLLPAGMYSDVILGLNFLSLFANLLPLGYATSSKRFLAKYITLQQPRQAASFIRYSVKMLIKTSIVFLFFLGLLTVLFFYLPVFQTTKFSYYHLVFYLLFLTPFYGLTVLLASFLQCHRNLFSFFVLVFPRRYMIFIIILFISNAVYHVFFTYEIIFFISLITFFILTLSAIGAFLVRFPSDIYKLAFHRGIISKSKQHLWRKTSDRFILAQVIFYCITVIDLFVAKILVVDSSQIDQYAALLALTDVTWYTAVAIYAYIAPRISLYIHKQKIKDPQQLKTKINQSNLVNLSAMLIFLIIAIFFGKNLIESFGGHYYNATSYTILFILLVGNIIGAFSRSAITILSYSGNERWLLIVGSSELLLLVTLCFLLTYWLGIIGTAIATSLVIILKSFFYMAVVHEKLKVKSVSVY